MNPLTHTHTHATHRDTHANTYIPTQTRKANQRELGQTCLVAEIQTHHKGGARGSVSSAPRKGPKRVPLSAPVQQAVQDLTGACLPTPSLRATHLVDFGPLDFRLNQPIKDKMDTSRKQTRKHRGDTTSSSQDGRKQTTYQVSVLISPILL